MNQEEDISVFIDDTVEKMPNEIDNIDNMISSTIYYQKEGNDYLLNKIYNGKLIFFARFFKLFPEIYKENKFQDYIKEVFERNNSVEILEGFGFNANCHQFFNSKRFIFPFTDSGTNAENQILLKDCYFKYSEKNETVKLYHEITGEIDAVFIGSLVFGLLPIVVRTILSLKPSTRFDSNYLNLLEKDDNNNKFIVDNLPRIKYKNIVLIRRQWLIKNIFNFNINYEDIYIMVLKEFMDNKLPLEFFVKKYVGSEPIDFSNLGRTELKPQYINLSSPLLFQEFVNKLEKTTYLILEELSPNNSNDKYVREFQIENTLKKNYNE